MKICLRGVNTWQALNCHSPSASLKNKSLSFRTSGSHENSKITIGGTKVLTDGKIPCDWKNA